MGSQTAFCSVRVAGGIVGAGARAALRLYQLRHGADVVRDRLRQARGRERANAQGGAAVQ